MNDGRKLTGSYGTWRGREVELRIWKPEDGEYTLIQDGGDHPGPEWEEVIYPNRFAKTPYHYYRRVPEAEVSQAHRIVVTGVLSFTDDQGRDHTLPVRIVAQDPAGRLAVQTQDGSRQLYWGPLERVFGFEEFERCLMFGWVPDDQVTEFRTQRKD